MFQNGLNGGSVRSCFGSRIRSVPLWIDDTVHVFPVPPNRPVFNPQDAEEDLENATEHAAAASVRRAKAERSPSRRASEDVDPSPDPSLGRGRGVSRCCCSQGFGGPEVNPCFVSGADP